MSFITIENEGPVITGTNFFESELNDAGKFFVSLNAGAVRLLVPDTMLRELKRELSLVKKVNLEKEGDWYFIVLDDGSKNPYTLQCLPNSFDRLPAKEDVGKAITFSAWGREKGKKIEKIHECPCSYKII